MRRFVSSATLSDPPAARTVAATPPGMLRAVSSVVASPIARTVYGAATAMPSTITAPGDPVSAVSALTRTDPNWIASAPAPRSSSMTSSRSSVPSLRVGSVTVTRTPGPSAGTVASSPPSAWACCRAAEARSPLSCSRRSVCCRSAICRRRWSACAFWLSRMPMRSSLRRLVKLSDFEFACTWTAIANPRPATSTPMSAAARCRPVMRGRGGGLAGGAGSSVTSLMSCPEQMPADRGRVAEDADAEDDDDGGRQLTADAELVAEEHDQRSDDGVGHERHDEDLRVEDAVESCAYATEHGVECRDDHDRQIRLEPRRNGRAEDESCGNAECERDRGDHFVPPVDGVDGVDGVGAAAAGDA